MVSSISLVPIKKEMENRWTDVSFDIDPSKQSWKLNFQVTVQVGMKVEIRLVAIPNGKAITIRKNRELWTIGVWKDNPLSDLQKSMTPLARLVNGSQPIGAIHTAFQVSKILFLHMMRRKKRNGWPGLVMALVWDKNGNGIIDDNTEMMSEFDENGNKRFQNGFENSSPT